METQDINMFLWRSGLLAVVLLASSACSTLEGGRFSHEGSTSGTVLKGVPFTLNRPVPIITRTPGDGDTPDKYVVKLTYEPDRSQRYTLQLDPAWFSNADFDMSYDVNGSLTDTSAKSTDQLAQVFTTVAKLAIAAGTFDKASNTDDIGLLGEVEQAGDTYFGRRGAAIFDTLKGVERPVTPADRDAWRALMQRVKKMAEHENVRKAFFYKSREEYDLLQTLLRDYRARMQRDMKASVQYQARFAEVDGKEKTRSVARDIDVARGQLNQRQLAKISATLTADRAKLRAGEELNLYSGDGEALADNYRLKEFAAFAKLPKLEGLLVDIADLEHVEWQRRAVAWLNKEIEARRYVLQMEAAPEKENEKEKEKSVRLKDVQLSDLLDRKAGVLGVSDIRKRELAILMALAGLPQAKDYDDLRAELAALEASQAAAESALKAKTAETKVEEPMRAENLYFAPQDPVQDSQIKRRLMAKLGGTLGEKLPRYVVVLQAVGPTEAIAPGASSKPVSPGGSAAPETPAAGTPPNAPPPAADPPPIRTGIPGLAATGAERGAK